MVSSPPPQWSAACAAALGVWMTVALEPADGGRSAVVLLWDSEHHRRDVPVACARCDALDVAGGRASLSRPYEMMVFYGHATPPASVLSTSLPRILDLVARAQPRAIVASVCHGGELAFLEGLFRASPRLELVLASPDPTPWAPLTIDGECVARSSDPRACVSTSTRLLTYRRGDLAGLRADAETALAGVRSGQVEPRLGGVWPHYLCVPSRAGPPVALVIGDADIPRRRPPVGSHGISLVSCLDGGHGGPAATEAAP